MKRPLHIPFMPLMLVLVLFVSSCDFGTRAEPERLFVESFTADPPVLAPGEVSEIRIEAENSNDAPISQRFTVTLLDGGNLFYERGGSRTRASGAGVSVDFGQSSPILEFEWTAPDSPGEYGLAVRITDYFEAYEPASDTLTLTVTE